MRRAGSFAIAGAGALCALLLPALAHAQSTIKRPGDRPHYVFELEPELVFAPFAPPNANFADGYGGGLRGTIEVLPDGFIPKLNDSVGIGFGADYLRYRSDDSRGECERFAPGPANTRVCVETNGGAAGYWYVPVVMQWNFWLHRQWSVFGEPGVAFYYHRKLEFSPFVVEAGGRFHFSEKVALTLRVSFPTLSLGVSFLL
jgi:hypothetical protein